VQLEQRSGRGGRRSTLDEPARRIERHAPDLAEQVARIALLDHDADRLVDQWKPQRLGKRPVHALGFGGGLPFAIDGAEAAREPHLPGRAVGDFEQVLAEVGVVERLRRIARPRQRLHHDAIEAEALLVRVARMEIVDAECRRLGGGAEARHEQNEYG